MRALRQPEFPIAQLVNHTYAHKQMPENSLSVEAANIDRSGQALLLIRKNKGTAEESLQWVGLSTFLIWLRLNEQDLELQD